MLLRVDGLRCLNTVLLAEFRSLLVHALARLAGRHSSLSLVRLHGLTGVSRHRELHE